MGSMVAREPVSRKIFSAVRVRVPPALRSTWTVLEPVSLPKPMTNSAPLFLKLFLVYLMKAIDHLSLVGADGIHIDAPVAVDDAELRAALKVRRYFGAMDDVFAGQAGNIGTGSAHNVLFDDDGATAVRGEMPGHVFTSFAAADNDCVVLLRGLHRGTSAGLTDQHRKTAPFRMELQRCS